MTDRKRIALDITILAASALVTLGCFFLIPGLRIDSSTNIFMPGNAEVVKINERIEAEFGSIDSIIVGVKVKFGSVLEEENLELVRSLTEQAGALKGVGRAMSIVNADYIKNGPTGMEVVPLLTGSSAEDRASFRARLTDWQDMYLGTIISKDEKLAAIVVQPEKGSSLDDHERIYSELKALTTGLKAPNASFPIAGLPVIKREINASILKDLVFLLPIAAFIILIILFFSFKRASGVIMPLIALVMSVGLIIGVIALFDLTITLASMLVPVILLVVGSAYSVHVMSHFYDDMAALKGFVPFSRIRDLTSGVLKKVWIPVLLAGLTTAAGFISNLTCPLGPFKVFGVLSAIGVAFSQITSLIIIPTLLRLKYRKGVDAETLKRRKKNGEGKVWSIFGVFERFVRNGRVPVIGISAALVATTILLVPRIGAGTDMIKFFHSSSDVVKGAEAFNEELGGSAILTVMIAAPEKSGVLDPNFLSRLDDFSSWLSRNGEVGHVQTLVPSIKRINKIMNAETIPYAKREEAEDTVFDLFSSIEGGSDIVSTGGFGENGKAEPEKAALSKGLTEERFSSIVAQAMLDAGPGADADAILHKVLAAGNYGGESFNEIPLEPAKYGKESKAELRDLISQYLVLYSGNLDMMINDPLEPDKTLVTIQLRDQGRPAVSGLKKDIEEYWGHYLEEGWKAEIGGGAAIGLALSDLVIESQIYSLIAALLIVWALVAIMMKSPIGGLFGMIPVAFALIGIFLSMVIFKINLDIITSLLGSLAIGIGVDYAIHFIDAYKRALREGKENVLSEVYKTTGKAIFINVASVGFGFVSLVVSRFVPIQQMGLLFFSSMICAGLSSLTILPAALHHLKPAFLYKNSNTMRKEERTA